MLPGVPTAFVAFYVYEKEEQKIDAMFLEAFSRGCKLKSDIVRKFCKSKKIEWLAGSSPSAACIFSFWYACVKIHREMRIVPAEKKMIPFDLTVD